MNNEITFNDIQKANETIKTIKIKRKSKDGKTTVKDYAEVHQRIKAFRMVYPKGQILPELLNEENEIITFKATITDDNGKVLAVAHARENIKSSVINLTNGLENCETSAIGRALGLCGFGVENSLSSAEELQNSIEKQDKILLQPMSEEQALIIASLSPEQKEQLRKFYKKDVMKLTKAEAQASIDSLMAKGLIKTKEEQELEQKEKKEVF